MQIDFALRTDLGWDELSVLWRDLETRADATFFLSWDWIGCWLAETAISPPVLVGRQGGVVVLLGALVPSSRPETGPIAIRGARLHATGDDEQDVITIEYNGFLVDRALGDTAEDSAVAFLMQSRRIDELLLRNVARDYAAAGSGTGLLHTLIWRKPSFRIDLDAVRATGRTYLDGLSANSRQQIRRSMRLYEKSGPLRLTRARDVAEAMAFLDGLKELHQPYWISRGERGAFAYPFFVRFQHRLITTCFDHGTLELVRISRGDVAIGYLYNLIYRRRVFAYQSGFLFEADAKLKPGLVSHVMCIEDHVQNGMGLYDFMAGDARYKSSLGQPGPDMRYVLVQRPTAMIRLENRLRRLRRRLRAIARPTAPGAAPDAA
jgi:CelD/BcsL family acetyltransferase involved in cellulose biosynthesis